MKTMKAKPKGKAKFGGDPGDGSGYKTAPSGNRLTLLEKMRKINTDQGENFQDIKTGSGF